MGLVTNSDDAICIDATTNTANGYKAWNIIFAARCTVLICLELQASRNIATIFHSCSMDMSGSLSDRSPSLIPWVTAIWGNILFLYKSQAMYKVVGKHYDVTTAKSTINMNNHHTHTPFRRYSFLVKYRTFCWFETLKCGLCLLLAHMCNK